MMVWTYTNKKWLLSEYKKVSHFTIQPSICVQYFFNRSRTMTLLTDYMVILSPEISCNDGNGY